MSFSSFFVWVGAAFGAVAVGALVWWRLRPGRGATDRVVAEVVREVLALGSGVSVVCARGDGRVVALSREAEAWGLVRAGFVALAPVRQMVREAAAGGIECAGVVDVSTPAQCLAVSVFFRAVAVQRWVIVGAQVSSERPGGEGLSQDLLANVSHELKTPVGAISLLAEALEASAEDGGAVRRFTRRLRVEAERLTGLITDTIDLSRIQGASLGSWSPQVRVGDVARESVDRLAFQAEGKGVVVQVGGAVDAMVRGDRDLLVTALKNVVDNAIRHSPSDAAVGVGVKAEGEWVKVFVTDRGEGMPDSERERIFERFYRVDAARSRCTGGSGLGLSIARQIVIQHGGTIQVWSQLGAGSTFTVRLPAMGAVCAGDGKIEVEEDHDQDTRC